MIVELAKIKPNPMRDFDADPIDEEAVAQLQASIKEHGFWGGVVCRKRNGSIEVAAGAHRIIAAMREGIRKADVHIAELDDDQMLRLYASENATQRGNRGTAQAGSVAAAVIRIVYLVFAKPEILENLGIGTKRLLSDLDYDGVGKISVLRFLHDIPGINQTSIEDQLGIMKASGIYAGLIRRAAEQVESDKNATEEMKENARKAAKVAEGKPVTFAYEEVTKVFKEPHQVDAFRRVVTRPDAPVAPKKQAALAKQIVKRAEGEGKKSISGDFIGEAAREIQYKEVREARRATKEEMDEERRKNLLLKETTLQEDFVRSAKSAWGAMLDLLTLYEKEFKPRNIPVSVPQSFVGMVRKTREAATQLEQIITGRKK